MSNATHEVGLEIQRQLGNMTLRMLGAKNLITTNDQLGGLQFKIGKNANKITHVGITLDYNDTYRVTFSRVNGPRSKRPLCEVVAHLEGVYVSSLHGVIETHTGMYTSL